MKKKKNTRLTNNVLNIIIGIICFAGVAVCLSLFWADINFSYLRANEKPIAVIYFKKNTAQRKFLDSNIWERLKTASNIYNGDIIRTGDISEAQAVFNDSSRIDLHANTLIQVFDKKNKGRIEFVKGSITVLSSKNESFKINAGNKVLSFPEETSAIISISSKNDNQALITVTSGSVEIQEIITEEKTVIEKLAEKIGIQTLEKEIKTNPVTTIVQGNTIEFDTEVYETVTKTFLENNSKGHSGKENKTKNITEAENSFDYSIDSENENDLNNPDTAEITKIETLENGLHKSENLSEAVQLFENFTPVILSPKPNKIFTENDFLDDNAKMFFSWEKIEKAENYVFSLYDEVGNTVINRKSSKESYSIKDEELGLLDNGKYTWEVYGSTSMGGDVYSTKKTFGSFEIKLESIESAVVDTDLLIQ